VLGLAAAVAVVSGAFAVTATSGYADESNGYAGESNQGLNEGTIWNWCGRAAEVGGTCSFKEVGHDDYLGPVHQVGDTSYNCGPENDVYLSWLDTVTTKADFGGDDLSDDPAQFNAFSQGLSYSWGSVAKTFSGTTSVHVNAYEKAWVTAQTPRRTVHGAFAVSLPDIAYRPAVHTAYTVSSDVDGVDPNASLVANGTYTDQPHAVAEAHSARMTAAEYAANCPEAGVNTARPDVPGVPTAVSSPGSGAVTVTVPPATTGVPTDVYVVTAQPGGKTCTPADGEYSCVISLDEGTYVFTAQAANFNGASQPSEPSKTVQVAMPIVVPATPAIPALPAIPVTPAVPAP
jgi:hypothetical protein